jgi:hypothetical protein
MSAGSPYWRTIPWGLFVLFFVQFLMVMDTNLKEKRIGKSVKDFLAQRAFLLRCWWKCRTKRCDYYQVYQALGAPDLTHVGYHAAERIALEHCASCTIPMDRECDTCKAWAERLRGGALQAIMGNRSELGERLIEEKKKTYGFY